MQTSALHDPVSEHVWRTRYQWREGGHMQEPSIEATWDRVALAVSGAEAHHHNEWRERFRAILADFRFLPSGRILAGAGTPRRATLFSCFVTPSPEDSLQGIFNSLREAMVTLQAGGGVGIDFSSLRPAGSAAVSTGGVASGPVSFLKVWEAASAVLESGNLRRGALMATLRCDHPDIEAFVDAKFGADPLPRLSLSVLLTEDFMRAVAHDGPWPLVFPIGERELPAGAQVCERVWPGALSAQPCLVHRHLAARALWAKLLAAQHAGGEPGVLFIDRINSANNLWYAEQIPSANPCGEVPLPPYGACNLGSINLTRFIKHPSGGHPRLDLAGLKAVISVATRFLDDVHDISLFPLKVQEKTVHASRRIGLGITGLADLFTLLGLRYGSPASIELTDEIMSVLRDTAYRTSISLAQEKGAFPAFDKTRYGASAFVLGLSHEIQEAIALHGMRNSHLLALAPTRASSLLANNLSSGIEPRPASAVNAEDQLRMMASVQSCVDNAIARTVRLPPDASPQALGLVLHRAWELGLKGVRFAAQTAPPL